MQIFRGDFFLVSQLSGSYQSKILLARQSVSQNACVLHFEQVVFSFGVGLLINFVTMSITLMDYKSLFAIIGIRPFRMVLLWLIFRVHYFSRLGRYII